MRKRCYFAALAALILALFTSRQTQAQALDLETGNAALDLVIPVYVPVAHSELKPGDAPIILHQTATIGASWFDAIAPYHPTAIGLYTNLARRPPSESGTHRQRNVAMLYASYHVLNSLLPNHKSVWDDMLTSVGLDPADRSTDPTTPVGIGNRAGTAVVAAREQDGINMLGDEGGVMYHRRRYADYTAYAPVNTPHLLSDPGRWQPSIDTGNNGIFTSQIFVTPQLAVTDPFLLRHVWRYTVDPPAKSDPANYDDYRAQADEVLQASANLTDEQKMAAEFFEHKFQSLAAAGLFVTQSRNLSFNDQIFHEVLLQLVSFDGAIAIWKDKYKYDAVRPFSAIRWLYGDEPVTAWGGPGKGTVEDITGKEWRSYLDVANHPEYPSASSCFCAAHAEASRRFTGTDELGFSITYPQGSSRVEPGITPQADLTLTFDTWSDFAKQCRLSRFWGGVHFKAATTAGSQLCTRIGRDVYRRFKQHVRGHVRVPGVRGERTYGTH